MELERRWQSPFSLVHGGRERSIDEILLQAKMRALEHRIFKKEEFACGLFINSCS